MFGRRQRAAEVEAIHLALAADAEARGALVEALGRIDSRLARGLEEQAQGQVVTDMTVQHLRSTVVDTRGDLGQAVEHLARVCAVLSERIEAERLERLRLVEAVTKLALPAATERLRGGERVLGGSFDAAPAPTLDLGMEAGRESHWA